MLWILYLQGKSPWYPITWEAGLDVLAKNKISAPARDQPLVFQLIASYNTDGATLEYGMHSML
jgi:hypothetical protein